MPRYLHFVSYTSTLTTFSVVSLHRWRLDSCVLPWVCSIVCLGVGNISCIAGDIAGSVNGGVGGRIGCGIGRRVNRGIGSRIGQLLLHFLLVPLQLPAQGDCCCNVVGEDIPIYF
jgi:hypothetical protein